MEQEKNDRELPEIPELPLLSFVKKSPDRKMSAFMSEVKRRAEIILERKPPVTELQLPASEPGEFIGTKSLQSRLKSLEKQLAGGKAEENKVTMQKVKEEDRELYRAFWGLDELDAIKRKGEAKGTAIQMMANIGMEVERDMFQSFNKSMRKLSLTEDLDNKDAA